MIDARVFAQIVCATCGRPWWLHRPQQQCYTPLEFEAALRFHQRHGRWPLTLVQPRRQEDPAPC